MAVGSMGWLNPKKHDPNDCLVSAGAVLTDIKLGTIGDYVKRLNKAYRAHHELKEKRAGEGTDLHALAEAWIKWKMEDHSDEFLGGAGNYPPILEPFVSWGLKNVKRFLFSEIHCYSERLWVGGKTDFGYEDMDGNYVLADIKSRDKDYFSDHVQCGGYDIQISENGTMDKNGNCISDQLPRFNKHAIFTLGDNFKEPIFSDPERNRRAFEAAVTLYKEKMFWEGK